MAEHSPYVVGAQPGFTPEIGRLVSMLAYARRTTLHAVRGLSPAQLDHLQDAESNSIGALLLHVAGVEVAYQCTTFERRGLSAAEQARWGAALDLGPRAREEIRGHALAQYVGLLEEVRANTLRELARRDDAWLEETTPFGGGQHVANNYFKWFHVMEDEVNHRGQIRWLRRRLPALAGGVSA
jgi:uncharacterized damage-inducible protein DinB